MYKGRAYMRIESTTAIMPQEVYNQMLFERDGVRHRWESLANPNLKIADLDEQEILKTVRLGIECGRMPENTGNDIPDILNRFALVDNGNLKHAAAILFAKNEMSDYFHCMIRLSRFRGIDKSEFIDNIQVRGNIFVLLDAAMSFVFKHLSLSGVVNGLEREEQLSVPYKALREAVINALCHRNYRIAGASVGIAIFDDRIVIENPGTLPIGWKIEDLKSKKLSAAQNPIIANVMYKRRLLESWGRGISLMIDECTKQGLPEPEFDDSCGFVTVTFRYKYHISTTQVPHKHHTSTTQVFELVKAIGDNTYSVKELMATMNLNNRSYFTKEYLQPAVNEGLISPIYPNQPRSPRQKYYLTEKGKDLIQNCN
jgi:ATP-dependent DNA helicase RecG